MNSEFVERVNSHDADRWAALFSEDAVEDAVLIPAGQPAVTGRAGIEARGRWPQRDSRAPPQFAHLEAH
ncbi:nuclear transport factor 2 family protein [Bradyrhizobium sp. 137]|uniref:nuclear transport factor 2 family protein n=1 Tax=Bradyrhizobium sp. 137 TaxID=2782614 RepID=UPI0031FE2486